MKPKKMNKQPGSSRIILRVPADDPADLLLDLLGAAGLLDADFDKSSHVPVLVVQALSPLWKQVAGALSTGPTQFAFYSVERERARRELLAWMREHLNEFETIELPFDKPGSSASEDLHRWLLAAGLSGVAP
jgi:hypothetical protein